MRGTLSSLIPVIAAVIAFTTLLPQKSWSADTVRAAAIQCYSPMGAVEANRTMLARLINHAATNGAKIIVTPECSITGYMNPARDCVWSSSATNRLFVGRFAEPVPGPSTKFFATIASNRAIYLCIALAESSGTNFFNTQVLLNPRGEIIAHHRKKNPWPMGDATWVTPGDRDPQAVETEYGRLGLMICYDTHLMPPKLAALHADIVLYSIGWYGPNTAGWFRNIFPERYVKPNHFAVIGSNWTGDKTSGAWQGQGFSFILDRDGEVLVMADDIPAPRIIYADLPIHHP